MKSKTILFLGDGMADEPLAALDGKTPLQAAHVPNMDWIAAHGRCGEMLTLPEGFPTSSDVANMSVLGGDLAKELCGRGPLEAASQGIAMGPDDVVFRMNLVTVAPDGTLADFSGGHIGAAEQQEANLSFRRDEGPCGEEAVHAFDMAYLSGEGDGSLAAGGQGPGRRIVQARGCLRETGGRAGTGGGAGADRAGTEQTERTDGAGAGRARKGP